MQTRPKHFVVPFRPVAMALAAVAVLWLSVTAIEGRLHRAQAADSDAVPYWVSLRNSQTNMRVGPGRDYRINWIYVRAGMPLKVLREMEGWVLVEDPDGARGWMLTQFVSRKAHTAVVRGAVTEIRENKDGSGQVMWRAEPGVVARVLGDCVNDWCHVDVEGRQGFVAESALWGAGKP